MMGRRGILVTGLGSLLLAACGLTEDKASYRVRMTVEVETAQGVKTGASVYEILSVSGPKLTSEDRGGGSAMLGEAVVVDTPSGPLFVLMKRADGSSDTLVSPVTLALNPVSLDYLSEHGFISAVRALEASETVISAELPRADWPLMVRFGDIGNPKTVAAVDPYAAGVKRIRLETTRDAMTTGIEKRLGWLISPGRTLDPESGPTINPTFAQTVYQENFSTEIGK